MSTEHQQEYAFLNEVAKVYDEYKFDTAMRHYMMRSLKPFLVPGKALEMGCFQGEFTTLLAEAYRDLDVVDASEEFIAFTRKRVPATVRFHNSLFETFESTDRYDDIFLLHILEHLQDPVEVLRKAKSLLSEKGRVFMMVPNGNAPSRQIAVKMGLLSHNTALTEADIKHGHRRTYTFDTLEKDAREAGLSILHRGGVFFKALANFQFERLMGGDVVSDAYMEGCYQLGQEYPQLCASIFLVCER
jgi:2-polyprenyl-3-methyl-5-hydroxy-6-metoxy-1,4-benzoquinol methylase